jgi:large subunit ribosomal protein L9
MEVILLQDMRALGGRGEVVDVKPGYARNYLYPKELAAPSTVANRHWFESQRTKFDARHAEERSAAAGIAAELAALKLKIAKRASESGTLYGAVTPTEVVEALAAKGVQVHRRMVDLAGGIKALGDHVVRVDLHTEVIAEVAVEVVPET